MTEVIVNLVRQPVLLIMVIAAVLGLAMAVIVILNGIRER